MSHLIEVKCDLTCSIQLMAAALLRINKEWVNHIQVDPGGTLVVENPYLKNRDPRDPDAADRHGFHIKIPTAHGGRAGAKDVSYADMGLKKLPDGTWQIHVDPLSANHVKNIKDHIGCMITQMKAIAKAKQLNGKVMSQETNKANGATTTFIEVEVDDGKGQVEA